MDSLLWVEVEKERKPVLKACGVWPTMEEGEDFSLCGKAAVTDANLRDDYYWKLVADFIGPQSGEGLELEQAPCKNRFLIQVGLMKEDNNFPWIAIVDWLKRIFPGHYSADFRRLIERGTATTLSLGADARVTFLESDVNFNFVGPICDSIGVERHHLLQMRDFSERAQSIEVTNGLIFELSNFIAREKIAPVVIVTWLRNFNPEFCKDGDIQKAYKVIKSKLKKLKLYSRNSETRSHRRNVAIENVLQSPFELVPKKEPKYLMKKRMRRDETVDYDKIRIKQENESFEIMQGEGSEMNRGVVKKILLKQHVPSLEESDDDLGKYANEKEASDSKGEALTLLDIAMLSVKKLSSVYGSRTTACNQVSIDLLKNQFILTCKEHPALAEFDAKLASLCDDISLPSPVVFLNYNANFLVDVHDAVDQHIMNFEKEIIMSSGEKLGRDKLQKFQNIVNMSESSASRYIHMACDVLSPRTPGKLNYRKYWVAFCKEKENPCKLVVNESNHFNNYFEAAAGLIHHHKETALFFSDLLSLNDDTRPNIILQSVAADANDSVIQSLVCVVAIVYCKVIGPYWQLLKSGGEYSQYSQYLLSLYQKFLDWAKNPSALLEPEEDSNVFLQFPLQEKTFDGVFQYCGQWHTNRELIRACLKRTIKGIAAVTEEHLRDFLPGGKFSQLPSQDLSLELVSCTFSVLMAEYPFGHGYPYQKKTPDKSSRRSSQRNLSSESSQEDGSCNESSDDSFERQGRRKISYGDEPRRSYRHKKEVTGRLQKRASEQNMDRDYITAMVNRNGGPCKSQTDVDKMMLRFEAKSRAEKREMVRCEILYQKLILNNTSPHLDCIFRNATQMVLKLKLALPRVKPGYSLVLAPRKTRPKAAVEEPADAEMEQSHSTWD
ncbi:uncharacterized protein LOC114865682 [Betta splendens]|uniref:Uncharacterized protein LOC114865682 n=1 Tax=Betta splendens TaxID=158456 RepID=A0A6P7NXZ9_BETSP|nr:uncharacterized protein LOC114865682 [Betta splendens]